MLAASYHVNAGAVAIESERAIAEARGQMQLAKMFPRSVMAAISEFMEACKSGDFAAGAFYSVPNRGSGPSIRFAEEAARCYGNFEYGHRELSRSDGKSEIEVFAWDKEKNNRSTRQITVMHVLDTKNGPRKLTDQADIDNKIANVASKQIRGRILALMPKHMILAGIAECKKTIAGNNDKPLSERVLAVARAFTKYGITNVHLERYLGHSVDETTSDELADLIGIGNALKEGAKPSEYFGATTEEQSEGAGAAAAIMQQAKSAAGKTNTSKKADAEPPTSQESKPTESNSKAAKESRRESGHKDVTAQPARDEPPKDDRTADELKPEQEGDVF
jgi:hypothetical protein